MKYFFSTGEASGEAMALLLAEQIKKVDPEATFEGIGSRRMRDAGFTLWRDHRGWASMGPLAAIPRIPKLLYAMLRTAWHIKSSKPDLVVLVDFGVFNLRLASTLRRFGYAKPILDLFPPGTWLDNGEKARRVAALTEPVTAFEHQYNFYRSINARIHYFGHPLASRYRMRPLWSAAQPDGGLIALLPGSRTGEVRRHMPVFADAYRELQRRRPKLRGIAGATDERTESIIRHALRLAGLHDLRIVRGVEAAVAEADVAWVSSGTAVLETALLGVPAVGIYVIPSILIWYGQRMIKHDFIMLPNLILGREVVPELLQDRATPAALADAAEALIANPSTQYAEFERMREALGSTDALDRCARYAVELARRAA